MAVGRNVLDLWFENATPGVDAIGSMSMASRTRYSSAKRHYPMRVGPHDSRRAERQGWALPQLPPAGVYKSSRDCRKKEVIGTILIVRIARPVFLAGPLPDAPTPPCLNPHPKKSPMHRLLLTFALGLLVTLPLEATEVFVAPNGSDSNPGTQGEPLATLEQARDMLRTRRTAGTLPAEGATVWIRGGVYARERAFELAEQDSGTEQGPVVYRAFKDEQPRISGGRALAPADFQPVTDPAVLERLVPELREKVLTVDLGALGVTMPKAWPDRSRMIPGAELFFDGQPMQIARWPNEGWVTIAEVIDRGVEPLDLTQSEREKGVRGGTFVYKEDRPARWRVDQGVWLLGFWCHDWASECLRVASIDPQQQRITLAAPHAYGIGPSSTWNKHPRRYYALNLLEELDAPGEWYLDGDAKRLYFLPPSSLEGKEVTLSVLTAPLVSMKDTSHVVLRRLTFETSQGGGVRISGGTKNLVAGCKLVNLADTAVAISGGTGHGVVSCDLWNLGRGGISLSGGDRKSLTPGEHYAVNNHIHHFARLQRTYAGGIHLHGVGNRAANNCIHDTPHSAIFYGGNEHRIELNEVYDVALETSDVGALYTGRDWTSRGNVVRHNYIHDLASMEGVGTMGVYLDDCDSGDEVVGNVFYKAGRAAFIGGGRDNRVANNIFIECRHAIHLDARGLRRAKPGSGVRDGWDLLAKAEALDFRNPPWSTRYPKLARVMDEEPLLPLGNVVERNVAVDCDKWLNAGGDVRPYLDRVVFHDNLILEDEDPGFVNRDAKNFQLKPDSIVYQKIPGFEPIPFDRIGLFQDEYRME